MATDDKKETHPLVQPGGERSLPLKKVTYKALIKYKIELSVQSRLGWGTKFCSCRGETVQKTTVG